jgi:hypothetical protein
MLTYGPTDKEIKAAYRKLSIELHPDKNPDQSEEDAQRFKQVCSHMLAYARVCSRIRRGHAALQAGMLTYAHVCSREQVTRGYKILYAHVCSRMLTYAHVSR